jgi:hypothetical protein
MSSGIQPYNPGELSNNLDQLFVHLTHDSEITSRLQMSSCNSNYRKLAKGLIDQATNPNVKLALEFISNFSQSKLEQIRHDSRFQTILKTVTVKK